MVVFELLKYFIYVSMTFNHFIFLAKSESTFVPVSVFMLMCVGMIYKLFETFVRWKLQKCSPRTIIKSLLYAAVITMFDKTGHFMNFPLCECV